jgi:hypothetical protein
MAFTWRSWSLPAVGETDFDFFSSAAQIIPLIFLVLAFEFRGQGNQFLPVDLQGDPKRPEARDVRYYAAIYTIAMTAVLAVGETVALTCWPLTTGGRAGSDRGCQHDHRRARHRCTHRHSAGEHDRRGAPRTLGSYACPASPP